MNGYNASEHPRPRRRWPAAPALVVTGLLGLALLAVVLWEQAPPTVADPVRADPRPVAARGDSTAQEKATIELFERCKKSVVYVSPMIRGIRRTLFGYYDVIEQGTGSGFVWDDKGHVVTNYHVIQNAESCVVALPDSSTYDATLVARYPDKDVAVLRIDAPPEKLVPIVVGTSKDLRVGQNVYAIGNPYGLDFTLTTGVVSALNRQIEAVNGRTIQGVIQTDAAINPGNSGGPLLDSAGRLIGMNTAILSRSGGSAGIGFAVPIDTIHRYVSQFIAYGKVIRPGLGVLPDDSFPRTRLGRSGVLIVTVSTGSAAERAGLQPTTLGGDGRPIPGDIIVRVGDTPTPDTDALLNALEQYEVGQTVDVTVDRGVTARHKGRRLTVPVTLQAIE